MMGSRNKGIILIFVLCLLAGLGAGCGKKTETQTQGTDNYVVKLGYYNCDHMTAACIAKDAGIFDKLGVQVQITGNGEVPNAMAAGQMDCGYVGVAALRVAYGKGAPVLVAANNHLGGSWYLVSSKNITDPKQLVGKKVALGTGAHETYLSWVLMANRLGIPADPKNYENFDMKDSDEYLAMKTGKLDAYTCCDPWASMAVYEQTGNILATDDKMPNGDWGVCCVYSMRKGFAQEHPELAKKMLMAHTQALEYIYTHPAKSAKIFAVNYKVPEEVALMTIYRKTVGEGRTLTWELDKAALEATFTTSKEMGIKNYLDYQYDPAFADTTLQEQAGVDDFDKFIKEQVDPVFPLGMTYEQWKAKIAQVDA